MDSSLPSWKQHLPNRISLARMLGVPVLLLLALTGRAPAFLFVFSLSLATDFVDGFLARRWRVQSDRGAQLDSWADALSWIVFTCGARVLWPDRFHDIGAWIAAALICFLVPGGVGLFKYRRLPGFHTWSAKGAMAGMGLSVLLHFGGLASMPFKLSVCLLAGMSLEETLMVHWLPRPRTDLRSARQAWRLRERD